MNIFISWSGEKSRRVALALKYFLQDVNQKIIAWFSEEDITAGQRWGMELANQLENTDYGIVCVTRESLLSHWVIFEAGALSKSVKIGRVCPYLVDLNNRELTGPLSQFQTKEANKEQTWQMLQSINLNMGPDSLPEERLKKYFEAFWPSLIETINQANNEIKHLPQALREKLIEVLPQIVYRNNELELYTSMAGISRWSINWNQAAIYVWSNLIQTAVNEKKLKVLLEVMKDNYPANPHVLELLSEVSDWQQ